MLELGKKSKKFHKELSYIINKSNIDTLILGCTHYPIMVKTIQNVLSNHINLVFSGKTVGNKLKSYLKEYNYENLSKKTPNVKFFVSDSPKKFISSNCQFSQSRSD